MSESLSQKLKNEAQAFFVAPVYPFLQKDWPVKMWLFIALSYVPVINLIVARGWRMEYIRRLGWRLDRVLPAPKDSLRFFANGLLLWIARGAFLLVPVFIIATFGLGGWKDLWDDIRFLFQLSMDFFWRRKLAGGEYLHQLWVFTKSEFIANILAFLIENIYLVVYVPIYRIGMIRFALTGSLIKSHAQILKNLRFLFRNFLDILLMYTFNIFNFIVIFLVDLLLTLSVVGVPLIPIVTFYMYYWNTGYEYGLLARTMVEQEGMAPRPEMSFG